MMPPYCCNNQSGTYVVIIDVAVVSSLERCSWFVDVELSAETFTSLVPHYRCSFVQCKLSVFLQRIALLAMLSAVLATTNPYILSVCPTHAGAVSKDGSQNRLGTSFFCEVSCVQVFLRKHVTPSDGNTPMSFDVSEGVK